MASVEPIGTVGLRIELEEVEAALAGRFDFEILVIDDGSTDATGDRLKAAKSRLPRLRLIRHAANRGQSAGVWTGVKRARGEWIATLDGDGQNNPAFLPDLIGAIEKGGARVGLAAGGAIAAAGRIEHMNVAADFLVDAAPGLLTKRALFDQFLQPFGNGVVTVPRVIGQLISHGLDNMRKGI